MKFIVRPFVLENDYGGFIKIVVLSYPNFCEAVVGTIMIAFILLVINSRVSGGEWKLREKYIPFVSFLIAGAYVLLQEYKVHNLGGNNVFDSYDVIFSVVGLVVILGVLVYIGPKVKVVA